MAEGSKIGVYEVACLVTGKSYIGSSSDVTSRLCHHKSRLRRGGHLRLEMQADFQTHGEKNFTFCIRSTHKTVDEALIEEARLIAESFRNGKAYNGVIPNNASERPQRVAKRQQEKEKALEATKTIHMPSRERPGPKLSQEDVEAARIGRELIIFYMNINVFTTEEMFLRAVNAFMEASRMEPEAVGSEVFGDPKFISHFRLTRAMQCTLVQATALRDYMVPLIYEIDRALHNQPPVSPAEAKKRMEYIEPVLLKRKIAA